MQGTIFTHRWVNVFYLQLSGSGITVNDLQTIANGIEAAWVADPAHALTGDVTLSSVTVDYVPSVGNSLQFVGSYSAAGSGGGTTVQDASACHVVDYVISASYRGGHPRSYVPGVDVSTVSAGSNVSSAQQSVVATRYNAFRNAVNALTSTNVTATVMGTVSFQTAGAWRTPPIFRAYTSVKYGNGGKLGSARRRIHS